MDGVDLLSGPAYSRPVLCNIAEKIRPKGECNPLCQKNGLMIDNEQDIPILKYVCLLH
jgi:hypothetical protein